MEFIVTLNKFCENIDIMQNDFTETAIPYHFLMPFFNVS